MKFILTDYQVSAVDDLLRSLRRATRDFEQDRDHTAISLSAPTGAGKTVIAAAVIERLFAGDDGAPSDEAATVLWITDDPSLNEQTRRKMLASSSSLRPGHLHAIDASFDQETLDPKKIYFLNIQKLGKNTSFVKGGVDGRRYSIWTTLANTVKSIEGHLYVVIDEAHRGAKLDRDRPTIVSKVTGGFGNSQPAAPVVWGISATPDRFDRAMDAAATPSRTRRTIKVPPEDVRESGLLKDKVLIKHPKASQPSDSTLLRLAVEDLRSYKAHWEEYAATEDEPTVSPVLVVQVKPNASERELAEWLATLRDAWSALSGRAVAHTFESHSPLSIQGQVVRYIEPQDIQDDLEVRAVLFKEALTTGWDCPRAEVMLSFRKAEDYTYIAQLIGRMVRTPLARRIPTDDVLNTVSLFLPYYKEGNVEEVIRRLREDPDAPATIFEENSVECRHNATVGTQVFEIMGGLPSYVVPGRSHRSQVARLHALAVRLAGDGIDEQAISKADKHLVGTLKRERGRLSSDGTLEALVSGLGIVEYQVKGVSLLKRDDVTAATLETPPDARNIEDLLKGAGRGLRDGLARTYWGALVGSGEEPDHAKLITAALAGDASVAGAVEAAAEELVQTWLRKHSRALSELPESKKVAYYAIRAQARASEAVDLTLPIAITAGGDETRWPKHIYVDAKGTFPARFTSWEEDALSAELNPDRNLVAWYRNPPGGDRALRVPYRDGEFERPLYPDFIFFHQTEDGISPSIVDPHNYAYADAGPKWRGLATYAAEHGPSYGRIDAVIKDDADTLLRLDLKDPTVRAALADVGTKDRLLQVFRDHGGVY